jgi:hypothetical protein
MGGCQSTPEVGRGDTDREYCRLDSIMPRAQALALTVLAVAA